jgi:hypothetical protein
MKGRDREPRIPPERYGTIRQEMIALLEGRTLSARDISADAAIPVREVYEHLDHIQRTLHKGGKEFIVIPAECRKCGFVFRKRDRLTKPGKCPVCRSELIQEPLFSIQKT